MILPQCIPGELGTPKVSPVSLHYSSASPFLLPFSEFSPFPIDLTIKTTCAHILWELNMQAR